MIMETPMMHDTDLAMLEDDDMLVALNTGPDDDGDSEDLFDDDDDFNLDELDTLEEFDDDFDDDDY